MHENARFSGGREAIGLAFMERVAKPKRIIKLAIQLHLRVLSLSNAVSVLESLGVDRAKTTIQNWVQKADLEPINGREPDKIVLDETVSKVYGERY